ncbi:hypothetical protein OGAPHI_004630 [Ogataea philodendri]|uniref:Uncharacterized protein n=1 Tax=Ogataea philodendri TaxID=1378263 RepID=A0A9P8T2X5_9ASCO|nr:uncharacterized protein OGAPHI_004630 [Ogataea philodendri]KAH3664278.1 hypothetical protein OGAPHI_004630 [Ogataea philodendri]
MSHCTSARSFSATVSTSPISASRTPPNLPNSAISSSVMALLSPNSSIPAPTSRLSPPSRLLRLTRSTGSSSVRTGSSKYPGCRGEITESDLSRSGVAPSSRWAFSVTGVMASGRFEARLMFTPNWFMVSGDAAASFSSSACVCSIGTGICNRICDRARDSDPASGFISWYSALLNGGAVCGPEGIPVVGSLLLIGCNSGCCEPDDGSGFMCGNEGGPRRCGEGTSPGSLNRCGDGVRLPSMCRPVLEVFSRCTLASSS